MDYSVTTGEVAIFDAFGGLYTWTETDGLVAFKAADLSVNKKTGAWDNWDKVFILMGAAMDGGGWYSLVAFYDDYPDGFDSEYGLYRLNETEVSWVEKMAWVDENIEPAHLVTDGDEGDIYITANGGWHQTIWRIHEGFKAPDDFYDESEEPGYQLLGAFSRY